MRTALLAPLLLAACGTLDTPDQVHDLRLLAMRGDPPDQVVAYDADAGLFPVVQPITVTALLADPNGNGRSIHTAFATCAEVDSDTQQCLPTSLDFTAIGESDVVPDGGPGAEASVSFLPSTSLLLDALDHDPYLGFSYLPLPVQITVSAIDPDGGVEQVVGVKLLTFTQPIGSPPQPANSNPIIPDDGGLLLNTTTPWLEGVTADLTPPSDAGVLVTPVPQPALWESYLVAQLDGPPLSFTEDWAYNFYCTGGQFSSPSSGGAGFGASPGVGQSTSVKWESADAGPGQLIFFWIVVTDGRGGTSWVQRQGQLLDP